MDLVVVSVADTDHRGQFVFPRSAWWTRASCPEPTRAASAPSASIPPVPARGGEGPPDADLAAHLLPPAPTRGQRPTGPSARALRPLKSSEALDQAGLEKQPSAPIGTVAP
ncbi:hypothetical protein MYSTI_01817 [Myxococcus stipitatus DSM 14675]|uniref:Uncharacterized protein n=1 Tax=Myxococcus stipitatus (strain DSM 14675 / JCM 12634 / Mx s8) TaxID=1278073 RepID=L7U9K6_MYXSD|nr:hypothetical protein MYSTI_01817 [Myxococcus stipitatus DSM 14675]